jgi:hypothetical protein
MPNQKEMRIRAEARAKQRMREERLRRSGVRPPSAAEANRELAEGMRRSGEDAAAAQAALLADKSAGKERMIQGHIANGDGVEPETATDRMDAWIDRMLADPTLEATLTAQQRMSVGHRLAEREVEKRVAEEEEALASGDQ